MVNSNLTDNEQIRALIIVPSICGLKDNYNFFLRETLKSSHVIGFCEIKISLRRNLGSAVRCFMGKAWVLGTRILINSLLLPSTRRKKIANNLNKQVFQVSDVNSQAFHDLLEKNQINLLIHARTRRRFSSKTLSKLKYGCINIHNGLLPWQRGIKCDLRSLARGESTGFTLHLMDKNIDTGPIITSVVVDNGSEKNYDRYIHKATSLHAATVLDIIGAFNRGDVNTTQQDTITGPRIRSSLLSIKELRAIHAAGIRV